VQSGFNAPQKIAVCAAQMDSPVCEIVTEKQGFMPDLPGFSAWACAEGRRRMNHFSRVLLAD
jgi:hypothetical protein